MRSIQWLKGGSMKGLMAALCALMLAASPLALAQDKAKKEPTAAQKQQQQRMADCNKQAGAKKLEGDARKKFMSTCLKG
jgi:Ni/Co efflux regulator RcnB